MNEVKNNNARKPLIYYYIIALLIMMLLNFLLFPSVLRRQEVQVDYSTFMSDLEDGKISQVEVQDQQIEYLLKDENNDWTVYITGNMGDHAVQSLLYQLHEELPYIKVIGSYQVSDATEE